MDMETSINLRENTSAISNQFAKFANIFSRQCFLLAGMLIEQPGQYHSYACSSHGYA